MDRSLVFLQSEDLNSVNRHDVTTTHVVETLQAHITGELLARQFELLLTLPRAPLLLDENPFVQLTRDEQLYVLRTTLSWGDHNLCHKATVAVA